jgi:hypothetical protein
MTGVEAPVAGLSVEGPVSIAEALVSAMAALAGATAAPP